jgi:hypothetical protein
MYSAHEMQKIYDSFHCYYESSYIKHHPKLDRSLVVNMFLFVTTQEEEEEEEDQHTLM